MRSARKYAQKKPFLEATHFDCLDYYFVPRSAKSQEKKIKPILSIMQSWILQELCYSIGMMRRAQEEKCHSPLFSSSYSKVHQKTLELLAQEFSSKAPSVVPLRVLSYRFQDFFYPPKHAGASSF